MPRGSDRPRLAVIVGNAITGDSRVQKTALSAAHAGWDVTLIGVTANDKIERSRFGPVSIVRVPVESRMNQYEIRRRRETPRARLVQFGLTRGKSHVTVVKARHKSAMRWRSERIARWSARRPRALWRIPTLALRAWARLADELHRLRFRAYRWEQKRHRETATPVGDWRRDWPHALDLDLALGPVIERLRPDVVHANDITMLPTAVLTAGRLRAAGHRVSWLYDAHEYVAGVDWPTPRMLAALPQMERELIHRADAVVTVSPEIAALLQREHDLPDPPLVVRNTPVRAAISRSGEVSVRRAAGVADDVPLLVYSGYVHAERGLDTAVEALTMMPDVRLAIVANRANPLVSKLEELAAYVGVDDRVHVVPYVPQHAVADYLSTADVGVICSQRTINYEMSLPTKFAEYLHAGLPVVCSDVKTLSAYVREHRLGEVFEAGDPESFAEAVREALDRRERIRAHITEPILEELSWEHQADGLLRLYARLAGRSPAAPATDATWQVDERPLRAAKTGRDRHPWRKLTMETPIRLGLGPANYAGQLAGIAAAITTARADVSAEVVMHTVHGGIAYPADVRVKSADLDRLEVQVEHLERILPRYTHLLNDAFRPILGRLNGHHISGDMEALEKAGIEVAFLSHGSDTRDPDAHMARNPWSYFRDAPDAATLDRLREVTRRNREFVIERGLPTFVTTPDLLDDLPDATWVPLVVDVNAWDCDLLVFERKRPLVLHAPSNRWTKGTDHFADQLHDLDARGTIEFRLVEKLPWKQIRPLVQSADLVIDQFGVGSYGTLACEAMAAGKPVMAHLTPAVVEAIGVEPPMINTTPDRVAAAIAELLDDRARAAKIGEAARAFVREYHDGTRAARALSGFLPE